MQSPFLLKSIFCMLIVNVTLCRSSFKTAICNAKCYWLHNGFDYGYYENGQCNCAPPTVYVFNGMGRDLSDEYIETSLNNRNLVEIPVTRYPNQYEQKSSPSTTVTADSNDSNMKTWKQIVETITNKYPFVEEADLENLKPKIADSADTMRQVLLYLRRPLEIALEDVKKLRPDATDECDELLGLLRRRKMSDGENAKKSTAAAPKPKPAAAAAAVKAKSVDANAWKNNVKPVEKGLKEEPRPTEVTTKEKSSQKIYVEMSEEYVNDDGAGGVKKAKNGVAAGKLHAVKKPSSATAEKKEHEVNGSGSGSGSWTYEEV